jgi:hypothetical protein
LTALIAARLDAAETAQVTVVGEDSGLPPDGEDGADEVLRNLSGDWLFRASEDGPA